ncbi:pilin [Amycolatopsis sp. CA-161197]|uniref:pilin n=1 Tax=Amycolatopsis sp. CA-161197 TaxID=3239922 RepID=UPI003D8E9A7B
MRLTPLRHHRPHPTLARPAGSWACAPRPRPHRPGAQSGPAGTRIGPRRTGTTDLPFSPAIARRRRGARHGRVALVLGPLVAAGLLLASSVARADTVEVLALAQTVDEVLTNIRNWVLGLLAGIALVLFTVAGLRYLLASGDPGEIEKAKGAFKAGCIGFALAALAPLVVEILKGIVGGV